MADFLAYIRGRIKETRCGLQSATDTIQQATAKRDVLTAELQAYEKTESAEMRHLGIAPVAESAPTTQAPIPQPIPTSQSTDNASDSKGDGPNKAEFARRFVREHPESGVTPKELYEGFVRAGIPIRQSYIYSLVQRLEGQTAIRKKRGRWYPTLDSERATVADESGGMQET